MWRNILGILIGIVVAVLLVAIVESIGHLVYPPPEHESNDITVLREHIASLPTPAFFFPLTAWLLGTLVGGWVAVRVADCRPLLASGVVGGFMLLATMINLAFIPHPLWMVITPLIGIPLLSWLASRLAMASPHLPRSRPRRVVRQDNETE